MPDTVLNPPVPCAFVSGRGRMGTDGYEPENAHWKDALTENGQGRDPMQVDPDILTRAGHGPRRTRPLVSAHGDPFCEIRTYRDIRTHCLDCAENRAEVRRCAVIDCPFWPYRMGRNPHNPRRGVNPFARKQG